MWSKCDDANFHMTFVVYVLADKYIVLLMLILPEERSNRDFIEKCDIQGAHITTAPKVFINSALFLNWIELFANYVSD